MEPVVFEKVKMVSGKVFALGGWPQVCSYVEGKGRKPSGGCTGVDSILHCFSGGIYIRLPAAISAAFPLPSCCLICSGTLLLGAGWEFGNCICPSEQEARSMPKCLGHVIPSEQMLH